MAMVGSIIRRCHRGGNPLVSTEWHTRVIRIFSISASIYSGAEGNSQNTVERDTLKDKPSIPNEELSLLTDNASSLPMLEAILNCPFHIDEWKDVSRRERLLLKKIARHFDPLKLPSVGGILASTKTAVEELVLSRWKNKMKKEIGEDGYDEYMKEIRSRGIGFHSMIQEYLNRKKIEDMEFLESGLYKSALPVLNEIESVHSVEKDVFHPLLCYAGRLDCVAVYRDTVCIVDWKSSTKKKATLSKCYTDPYQVAAYAGAYNITNSPSLQVAGAVIVKVYTDGSPADAHYLNQLSLDFFWNGWLRKLARHHMHIINSSV